MKDEGSVGHLVSFDYKLLLLQTLSVVLQREGTGDQWDHTPVEQEQWLIVVIKCQAADTLI